MREAHLSDQAKSQAQEAEDIGQGPHGLDGGHGGGGGGAVRLVNMVLGWAVQDLLVAILFAFVCSLNLDPLFNPYSR